MAETSSLLEACSAYGQPQAVHTATSLLNSIANLTGILLKDSDISFSEDPAIFSKLSGIQNSLKEVSNHAKLTKNSNLLPDKETLPPNKKTKTETAESYGRQKSILPMRRKHRRSCIDPYSGGERSGKFAKKDALQAHAINNVSMPGSSFSVCTPIQYISQPSLLSNSSNTLQTGSNSVLFTKFRL